MGARLVYLLAMFFFKVVVAPWDPGHPLNRFNSIVEPWWQTLSQAEKERIYTQWENIEPLVISVVEWMDAVDGAKNAAKGVLEDKILDFKTYVWNKHAAPESALASRESTSQHQTDLNYWLNEMEAAKLRTILAKKYAVNQIMNQLFGKKKKGQIDREVDEPVGRAIGLEDFKQKIKQTQKL